MLNKPIRTRGSIDDVAREAQVSRSTASRVLRGLMKVSPQTKDRIFAAAEKLSYRPNLMARALRTGELSTVALILTPDQIANPIYSETIGTLKQGLEPHGLKLIVPVISSEEDPVLTIEDLSNWC